MRRESHLQSLQEREEEMRQKFVLRSVLVFNLERVILDMERVLLDMERVLLDMERVLLDMGEGFTDQR